MKNNVAEKQPISAKKLVTAIKSLAERNQHRVQCVPSKKYAQSFCSSGARERWTHEI